MVKLLATQTTINNGEIVPVMFRHTLLVTKDAPSFKKGETIQCFIAKYDNGRYCVWTASFIDIPNYHVFESEKELHEHFDENL